MANKDGGFEDFLNSIMNGMGPNGENLEESLSDMYNLAQELTNKQFYRYRRPNYMKDYDRIIPDWLGPIWNAQHDDPIRKLCEFVADDGKDIPKEQKHAEIKKFLWSMFDSFNKDEMGSVWKLYGIYWQMEHFGIRDIDLVLEALRQDAFFVAHYTLEVEDLMVDALYQNTGNDVSKLKDFMYQQGLVPAGKQMVFRAIAMRITQHPEERLSIVSWLLEYLNHSYKICIQGAYAGNLESYIQTLVRLNIHEAMPMIEKIINDIDIPFAEYTKDIDTIRHDINTPHAPITEQGLTLDHQVTLWDDNNQQDDDHLYDWLDDDDLYEDDEESALVEVFSPQKEYTIDVEWSESDDLSHPISVRLTVPSNIYLHRLANLIMIAFERKDVPSWYFMEDDYYTYATPQGRVGKKLKKENKIFINATQATLDDILNDDEPTVHFYTTFPNGEKDWKHEITLVKENEYSGKQRSLIKLVKTTGVYPSKKDKHAADYIKKYEKIKDLKPQANDKAIREAIRDFEDTYL